MTVALTRRGTPRKKFDKLGRRLPKKRRGHYKGLRAYIIKQLDYTAPIGTSDLFQAVTDDYGTINHRCFYMHLAKMRKDGSIMFKRETYQGGYLYTRPRR